MVLAVTMACCVQVLNPQHALAKTLEATRNSSQQYQAELERAIAERTQKGTLFEGFFAPKVGILLSCSSLPSRS